MTEQSRSGSSRLSHIDWLRGLAIVIMIEAHVLDAWTLPSERHTLAWGWAGIIGGFAAPTFLFLAGLSGVLAAGHRARKTGDVAQAAASVRRRGWEVFGLAYLFRLQAYALNPGAMVAGVLKVDILNVMGPSIVAAAALWQFGQRFGRRLLVLGGAMLTVTLATPLIRTAPVIGLLPDPIEWYLRPIPGRNNFTFFPWTGFVFAGALLGALIDRPRERRAERLFYGAVCAGGFLLAAAAYGGSFLPSIYADSRFWTSSPMFFLLRVGIVTGALGLVYFWEQRPRLLEGRLAASPMALFGRASLFVYWVHVELAYGMFSGPLHKALSFNGALIAFVLFTVFMFGMAMAKNRLVAAWKEWRRSRRAAPATLEQQAS